MTLAVPAVELVPVYFDNGAMCDHRRGRCYVCAPSMFPDVAFWTRQGLVRYPSREDVLAYMREHPGRPVRVARASV